MKVWASKAEAARKLAAEASKRAAGPDPMGLDPLYHIADVRKAALAAASAAQAIHTEAEASTMLASETAILSREPKAKRDRIASIAQSSHSKAAHTENLTIEPPNTPNTCLLYTSPSPRD